MISTADHVNVMTQNVYLGADLRRILTAKTQAELCEVVATAWSQVQESRIPERADKIAELICEALPDLVGLQEVARWYHGKMDAMRLQYDFLESILASLRRRGTPYVPLAIGKVLDQTMPKNADELVRLVDRDVVLMRDADMLQVRPYDAQPRTFSTILPLTTMATTVGWIPRGYIAVDCDLNGRRFA